MRAPCQPSFRAIRFAPTRRYDEHHGRDRRAGDIAFRHAACLAVVKRAEAEIGLSPAARDVATSAASTTSRSVRHAPVGWSRPRRRAGGHGRRPRHRGDPLRPTGIEPDMGDLAQHTTRPRPMAGVSSDPMINVLPRSATDDSGWARMISRIHRPRGPGLWRPSLDAGVGEGSSPTASGCRTRR